MSLALRLGCHAARVVAGATRRVAVAGSGCAAPRAAVAWGPMSGLSTSTHEFPWDPILPPLRHEGVVEAATGDAAADTNAAAGGACMDGEAVQQQQQQQPLMDQSVERYVDPAEDEAMGVGLRTKAPRPDGTYGFKGGRKRATAYVTLKPAVPGVAEASYLINGKPVADYFHTMEARQAAAAPVILTSTQGDFVIRAQVSGGGMQGQAEAVRQALAHGVRFFKPEYRRLLRSAGYVTRDRRKVEAKKPGRKKARKLKTKPYR